MTDLVALEQDLRTALAHRIERGQRRRRRLSVAALIAVVTTGLCAAAVASGIAGDLGLDPTKWEVLGGGSVDNGRGAYVHAQRKEDGSNSTFMVEHDAGLPPYRAFLLHEQTLDAAQETSPVRVRAEQGELCTAAELTRAESVALAALRASFAPGQSWTPRSRQPTEPSLRSSREQTAGASNTPPSKLDSSTPV